MIYRALACIGVGNAVFSNPLVPNMGKEPWIFAAEQAT
jgi:uncharacterized Fe-S cluster protein YjdI